MAKSTKPKGATSYKETAFGILPRSKVVHLEKKGVVEALEYILKLNSKNAKITPRRIRDIHKTGFGLIFPEWAGKYRTIDVTVGNFEPPHYSKVPELIQNLCNNLEERLKHLPDISNDEQFLSEAISILTWFQHQFVWIHPFKDYNGRVARLVTNLLALNLRFPIITIKADTGKDRENYINAMKTVDNHDLSKLEKLITDALRESLQKV